MAVVVTGLSACGFYLRGQSHFKVQDIFVEGYLEGPTIRLLKNHLESQGFKMIEASQLKELPEKAILIRVLSDKQERVVVASTVGSQIREVSLQIKLAVQPYDAKRRAMGEPFTLSVEQAMSYTETQDLAKQSEEARLFRDLQMQLVYKALPRLMPSSF